MTRLQIRLFGPHLDSFSTNSYGYYSQTSQNLVSNSRIFASARIARQSPKLIQREDNMKRYLKPKVVGSSNVHPC